MLILTGDIGGTNARVAIAEITQHTTSLYNEANFATADFSGPLDIVAHSIATAGIQPELISLGIAGPVRNQVGTATNLSWSFNARELEQHLNLPNVYILNDLEAIAWGISRLVPEDYLELHAGQPDPEGNISVIAIGTGLGKAGICRHTDQFHPFATEGGHADFAPATELEWELFKYLQQNYPHVSWERIVSGTGIPHILEFLVQYREGVLSQALQSGLAQGGGASLIAAAAKTCPLCAETMELFVSMFGREVGNHALNIMATGGIYLAGGIAPKILSQLQNPNFLATIAAKGRLHAIVHNMPVRVILNDQVALRGAALAGMAALAM
ncbi:hypothetical protein TI04_10250 [Achromatium sp. WMS2]|nr:hypothetical protein TI04_10250 [Achromatium sp. WMS2]